MICAHGRVFSNNNINKMSSRFVIEGQRAGKDEVDVEKSNEETVALNARKGKRVEYYQDGTGEQQQQKQKRRTRTTEMYLSGGVGALLIIPRYFC